MLVLALLGMVMMLAVPAFQSLLQDSLDKEINRLTGVLRLIRNEAVLTRKTFRLMFHLKEGRYSIEEKTAFGNFVPRGDPKALMPHQFPASFVLKDIVVLGNRFERRREAPVPVVVNNSGFVQPFLLHFSEDGKPWTLKVRGFTAKITLEAGDVDFDETER